MEAWLALLAKATLPLDGSGHAWSRFLVELPHAVAKLKIPDAVICPDWF